MRRRTRREALRTAALAGGAGGLAVTGARGLARSAGSPAQTRQALSLVLLVEDVEAAFFQAAVDGRRLTGELGRFAATVAPQERAHAAALRDALGSGAPSPPRLSFGAAVQDPARFTAAAIALQDLAVAAYNGQAGNVGAGALATAATIVSVEARHAGWIRAIAGRRPAENAVDLALSADRVKAALQQTGFLR